MSVLCCLLSFFSNKTKWLFGLHLVVLFRFWLFCVHCFLFLSKKKSPKNGHSKNPQKKYAEKKTNNKNQLAQLCSQIVFLIFGGWATKCCFCWKPYKNMGFRWRKEKRANNVRKVEMEICPRLSWKAMLRNIIGQIFNSTKCVFVFRLLLIKIAFSVQKEEGFWKLKREEEEHLDRFSTQKRAILDRFSTPQLL